MANDPALPSVRTPLLDEKGLPKVEWRKFFESIARVSGGNADLQAQIAAILVRLDELESGGGDLATFVQGIGISIVGQITDPIIRISLNAYLDQLLDVDTTTTAPADGDALVWDATLAVWKPGTVAPPVRANRITTDGNFRVTTTSALRVTAP